MKKTKIVCTMGPATESLEVVKKLIKEGMNVARFNMSHGTHEYHEKLINVVKQARSELNVPIAIMIDLKGPEIRIRQFENGKVCLKNGQKFVLTTQKIMGTNEYVSVNYSKFPKVVMSGDKILLNDGLVELKVIDKNADSVLTKVIVGGELSNNKSINIPNVDLGLDFLSECDKSDIEFARDVDAEMISLSYVSGKEDVLKVRRFLQKINFNNVMLISKIENRLGTENIDEIVDVSDGVMVARGDMGVEIEYEKIPAIQKQIISACRKQGKISITATQMLESMVHNPRPTRAEISDVANACIDGSTCVMLSGETSAGNYPVESVNAMRKIIEESEKHMPERKLEKFKDKGGNLSASIGYAACGLAESLGVSSILAMTKSGQAAASISRFRPNAIILACTPSKKVYYQMSALWGVVPLIDKEFSSIDDLLYSSKQKALETKLVKRGESFVEVAGLKAGESGINLIRVETY